MRPGRLPFAAYVSFLAVVAIGLNVDAAFAQRPNVILLMADDLGWGDVGFNGNRTIATPHLDAMAAAGMRLNHFYAAAPVCSPTRGSCLTGRNPYRYGIFSANVGHLPAEENTLAELLRAEGYRTGHFGKWHLGTLTTSEPDANRGGPQSAAHYSPPWENGFDTCFSTESKVPTWDPMIKPADARDSGPWWDPLADAADGVPYNTSYWSNGKKVEDALTGDDSRIIMDRAIPFIEGAAAEEQPFFAVIWFHAPHLPVVAGPEYMQRYAEYEKYEQHYYGCITALDEQVGRLRQRLREIGVADNTMLWFCSDNGPEGQANRAPGSAGTLRGRKRDLLEGGVRVPAIWEWPERIEPGTESNVVCCTSDYLPTVLDVLHAPLPDDRPLDGISLLPLVESAMQERPSALGFQYGRSAAWVDGPYKLLEAPGTRGKRNGKDSRATEYQLFDLVSDPGESHDLASQQPQRVREMAAALTDWKESCRRSWEGADYTTKATEISE